MSGAVHGHQPHPRQGSVLGLTETDQSQANPGCDFFPWASLLADIRSNTAEVFDDFELQVCGVHEALWFQAFVGAMPKGLLTTEQLQKIRKDNKDDTDQYPALKTLILETYVNINAHQQARKKFETLTKDMKIKLITSCLLLLKMNELLESWRRKL